MFGIRICILFLAILSSINIYSQVTAAEYFFDEDPGPGKGKAISVGTSNDSVHFVTTIPTTSLQAGFHTLSIRAKTGKKWGIFETRSFYISQTGSGKLSDITAAEYFFDNDPGPANGKPISVGGANDSVHFTATIPTTSLQAGFHTLSIRTKTTTKNWGIFETRSFYISQTGSGGSSNITAAEYFFDNDPGPGNGKPVSVGAKGDSVHFIATIPTTSLQAGFHTLSIRTKTATKNWGIFETRSFYISQTGSGGLSSINAAEYFFDNDPGPGNGKPVSVGTANDSVHFIATIPTKSLQAGFHTLSIRTRTATKKWGIFETRSFYISQPGSGSLSDVIAAEYFFDDDPGAGNGKKIPVGKTGDSVHFIASVPTDLLAGKNHFICIRVKNKDGSWSIFETSNFAFAIADKDRDGLIDYEEGMYGTNYKIFDTNGDELADGVNVFTGLKPLSKDADGDKISNAQEIKNGTSPILKDTDGDGVPDNLDAFPLNPFRTVLPPKKPSDHQAPVITLLEPPL
jgi:hypothetical protein